jgi:hypothetical protein
MVSERGEREVVVGEDVEDVVEKGATAGKWEGVQRVVVDDL